MLGNSIKWTKIADELCLSPEQMVYFVERYPEIKDATTFGPGDDYIACRKKILKQKLAPAFYTHECETSWKRFRPQKGEADTDIDEAAMKKIEQMAKDANANVKSDRSEKTAPTE